MSTFKNRKLKNLVLGLLFDAIGMISYIIPGIGEFTDIIWAPIAGWLMTRMYKGKMGRAAGVVAFIEELVPGLDIIPSFTIMWCYTYLLNTSGVENTIFSKK
ncbi:hypothetical protein KCTC52924_03122 [Arenibacter antarcticus]|uniref:Uncharacterized protein n=1 Tax=Arenibacter antarcticus TaxID=2040469 RepID=A0ABW5VJ90_9FLAO|nr:hypothetical protein [Arenibacter sp. H213]MCM4166200.1 hypothetical protein [Arenibacter sp. H213]